MEFWNRPVSLTIRRAAVACGVFLVVLLLALGSFGLYFDRQIDRIRQMYDEAPSASAASVSASTFVYTLREHENKIGIFLPGEREPLQILDVFVFTLPEADRAALHTGIRVYSQAALLSLIEDFTG